uniref:BHLH domain-containing protein n=1 Tax=Lepeophtheirus salmonis TaxID=72036 RepID=A0A0K2TQL8_LEPSM
MSVVLEMEGEATTTNNSSEHLYQVFQNSYNKVAQNGLVEDYCESGVGSSAAATAWNNYSNPGSSGPQQQAQHQGGSEFTSDYRYSYEGGGVGLGGGGAVPPTAGAPGASYYNPYDTYGGSHYVEGMEGAGGVNGGWGGNAYVSTGQQPQQQLGQSSQVKAEYEDLILSGPSPSSSSASASSSYLPPQPPTSAHDDFSSMLGTDFLPIEDGRRSRGSTTSSTKSSSKGRGGGGGGKRKKVEELVDPLAKAARDKERRFSNNTRERMRIRDINDALTELGRICMSLDGKERTEKPQTKLGVLNMAVDVITKLEQRVRDKNLNPAVLCLNRNEPRGASGPHAVLQQQHYESPSLDMNQRR